MTEMCKTSPNTVYTVRFAHLNCAFGTTSHTPIPLGVIGGDGLEEKRSVIIWRAFK